MNREVLISVVVAIGCHGLLLFGFGLEKGARPLPMSATPTEVEVGLVEAAPQSPAPTATEVAPPPPEPPVEPPPVEPVVEPPTKPAPEPAPKPRPAEPRSVAPRVAKPAAPAPRGGAVAGPGAPGLSGGTGPGDSKPRYRSNPRPDYPGEARRLRQEGRVILEVEVSAAGRPTSVSVASSSGVASLDAAALAAVRRWSFEPARAAGLPVAARVKVPVQFDLAR